MVRFMIGDIVQYIMKEIELIPLICSNMVSPPVH
jgi:hypothetical protein